jgi:hypothetical protein
MLRWSAKSRYRKKDRGLWQLLHETKFPVELPQAAIFFALKQNSASENVVE